MKSHPAAEIFPRLDEPELIELAKDISKNGLMVPIITLEGMILDGRNRFAACEMASVRPVLREYDGDASPTEFVLSVNLRRRHLTASQKAAAAVAALPMLEAEAKARMFKGGCGSPSKVDSKGSLNDPAQIFVQGSRACEQAAVLTGANHTYVQDAKNIKESHPDVFQKVVKGEISIPEAKRQIQPEPAAPNKDEDEPVKDSPHFWALKHEWRLSTKKDRVKFLEWANNHK